MTRNAARFLSLCGSFVLILTAIDFAHALDRTWIGGNVDWVDAGTTANWNPADEPDSDDTAIFNTANSVNLGSNNAVNGLTMSGGIDLNTNEFDLTVDGLVTVGGASTNLFIGGAAGSINADNLTINASGIVELRGGLLTMDEEVGTALIDINAGGTIQGNGQISYADNPGVGTAMLVNDGTLTALSRGLTIFSPPPVGLLQLSGLDATARLDLDGAGEAGVVNINRNQKLATDMPLFDTFNGTLNLFHNSELQMGAAFNLGTGGSVIVDNGFVAGGLGFSDIPADIAMIDVPALNQSGGTINVVDTDGTLNIDSPFNMTGGTFTNMGTVIFNGTTNITAPGGYAPNALNAQTIVNANVTINHPAADFNWDGNGVADTIVNGTALLSITADEIDTGNDTFGGTLTLNDSADLTVNNTVGEWQLAGGLIKNGAGVSSISGAIFANASAIDVNAGTLDVNAATEFALNTDLFVASGATADFAITSIDAGVTITTNGTTILGPLTVIGIPGALTGNGLLRFNSTSVIAANTTITASTFDWDGTATGAMHTINSNVALVLDIAALDSDGEMDDPFTLAGSGSQLIVNNTNGLTQWTMNGITTANTAGVGTATIGGTSRMIVTNTINVDGNTNIAAPVTFNGTGFVADIDVGMTLNVTGSFAAYADGTIDGAGTFDPASSNTVSGDFTINADRFDFDGGTWTVESGAVLTLNSAVDYEPDSVTNSFESMITLNNGGIFASVADPTFVMNGTLEMNASGGFDAAEWQGDAIDIGNDAGALDANLNVTGDGNANSQARFFAPVTFKSDADVNVPAGAFLVLNRVVNFDTVNAANSAEFTGAGTMIFSDDVNVNEAVTLNMPGGTIDLDGNDNAGDLVNVDAPLTINAATMANFGRVNGGGGVNTLDVNNSVGTGVLSVTLDDPAAEWTLNGPGVMNLVNDNAEAILLAGSDVNVNGTVNVIGDVRTTARLDIAGVVNINTAGQPLRLAGGTLVDANSNTIAGATIGGAGILGADNAKALLGFGVINTSVDFDGNAELLADNGTLTLNGAIVDVGRIGVANPTGTLNVVNAWNTSVADFVTNFGGTISGGTVTVANADGIGGGGLVTARVINNSQLRGSLFQSTHVFQTAGNDNDWDGAANTGILQAQNNSTLELRDNALFGFTGTVIVENNSRMFTNGFALGFNPGSTISLTAGIYESTHSTDVGGTVTVGAGSPSTIKVENNRFLSFETGSATTLNGNLQLQNNNIIIEAGATFAGAGALVVPDGSHLVADNLANIGVLLDMQGGFRPGNSEGIGRVDLFDYQQADTGELFVEVKGTALNAFDRLVASGDVVLDGYLNIDIDEVSPGVPFVPVLGQTFNIITGNTVTGTFDYKDVSGMPAGLAFHINYLANAVQLQVVNKPIFAADFDDDGDVDPTDYNIWKGAFGLNQLGDANGDNLSDAADYTIWRDTFGSVPGAGVVNASAVPEPTTWAILVVAVLMGNRLAVRAPMAHRGE